VNGSIKPQNLLVPLPLAIFICSWFLLCVSSFIMAGFFNFVPSAEWLAETNLLRTIDGSLSAGLFVWFFWKGEQTGASRLYHSQSVCRLRCGRQYAVNLADAAPNIRRP